MNTADTVMGRRSQEAGESDRPAVSFGPFVLPPSAHATRASENIEIRSRRLQAAVACCLLDITVGLSSAQLRELSARVLNQ